MQRKQVSQISASPVSYARSGRDSFGRAVSTSDAPQWRMPAEGIRMKLLEGRHFTGPFYRESY